MNAFANLKRVLSIKGWIIFLVSSAIFYEANAVIYNLATIYSVFKGLGITTGVRVFLGISAGFWRSFEPVSFAFFFMICIVFGIFVSSLAYKASFGNKKRGKFGMLGGILGLAVPGCASCGAGLLPAFGLGAAVVAFLPFDGLEISAAALAILMYSTYKILLNPESCEIDMKDERRKNGRRKELR